MISAVLIVKNEEALLGRCLDSLKGKVDEIVIVDTGSTDQTKEIAKRADVYSEFEWCDDFAKARNYAKSLAKHDLILSIDADEVLSGTFTAGEAEAYTVRLIGENGEGYTEACRLFHKKHDWIGAIHEYPNVTNPIESWLTITFGRSPTHDQDPKRNLRILARRYQENEADSRNTYYLARELVSVWAFQECLEALNKYREHSTFLAEIADSYLLEAVCHERLGNRQGSLASCAMCLACNPDIKVAWEIMHEITKNPRYLDFAALADDRNTLQKHSLEHLWTKVGLPE